MAEQPEYDSKGWTGEPDPYRGQRVKPPHSDSYETVSYSEEIWGRIHPPHPFRVPDIAKLTMMSILAIFLAIGGTWPLYLLVDWVAGDTTPVIGGTPLKALLAMALSTALTLLLLRLWQNR